MDFIEEARICSSDDWEHAIQQEAEREAAYHFAIMDFVSLVKQYGLDKCLIDLMIELNEERIKRY